MVEEDIERGRGRRRGKVTCFGAEVGEEAGVWLV